MSTSMKKWLGILSILGMLTGCSTTNPLMENSQNALRYDAIRFADKASVIGKDALIGGEIISLQRDNLGTRVEIKSSLLTDQGFPSKNGSNINHRAMIIIPKRLNLYDNRIGDKLTALGAITDIEEVPLGDQKMTIVLLEARAYKVWNQADFDDFYGGYYGSYHRGHSGFNSHRRGGFGMGVGFGPFGYY